MRPSDLPISNHYASKDFALLSKEYEYLWSICSVNPNSLNTVLRFVQIVKNHKPYYLSVQTKTNVPWYVVAANHMREASCDFDKCLANGQPWDQKTSIVPIGVGPWDSWVNAAIWAYEYQGTSGKTDWTLSSCFYRLEAFNGFGYRLHDANTIPKNASPYIYSMTPFYEKGLFVADHRVNPNKVDANPGCMALLKALQLSGETIF